jgi:hypothetical protein
MASYTDKIPTFNPYVQQLPVEAMVKVGMYKQQKYEEGLEKIQTSIDNVAGLDVVRDVDKNYLQSKLNQLGNDLKGVAAGDFSNFQLVNSVNGMTNQISKDENVINAVSSTAKIKSGYAKREELSKKGLTDKNNDDYYDKYVKQYSEDTDLKSKFSAEYVPYTNIVKTLQEALVAAGETKTTAEELFVTDPDTGKPIPDKNGHLQYADAKAVEKLVSNKPAVLAAINNVLNQGDVKQQLGIDGWATYRNTEATTLLEPLKIQYDAERERLQKQSLDITALLTSTNLSKEQKELYTKASSDIEASLLSNDKTFMSLSDQAANNPEQFKQNYYVQDYKHNLLNQFLKTDEEHTTGTNEALAQQNVRDRMAFDVLQEKNKIAYQNQTLAVSKSADKRGWIATMATYGQDPVTGEWYKKDTTASAAKKKAGTVDANAPLFSGNVPGDKVSAVNIMKEDISTLTESKGQVAFTMYADLIRANKNDYNLTDDTILASVKNYATKQGITPDQYLDRWAVNIKNKYAELGLKPPPNLEDELNQYTSTSKTLKNKMTMSKAAEIAADKEAGVERVLGDVLKDKKSISFNVDGNKIIVEPRDMLGLVTGDVERLFKSFNRAEQQQVLKRTDLTNNQRKLIANWEKLPWEMRQNVMKEFSTYTHGPSNISTYNAALSKSNELFNDKLSKIVGVTDVKGGSLPMFSADQIKASVANVSSYLSVGMRSYGPGDTEETVQAALADPTSISWTGKKPTNAKEEWTGTIIVKDKKGVKHTITNVNHEELQQFTGLNLTNYEEKPVQDLLNMNDKTKSTNSKYGPSSPKAWTTSYYQGNDVNPEVVKAGWGYRADAVSASGGYRLVNYIKAPGKNNWITIYGGAIAKEEGMIDTVFKTASPKDLENLYMMYLQNQNK